ncbi:enoyl-CoA hydratase family protein [Wenjunlia vitaminophila]|uniref:enoyl-CoA hydratase family protein n=1 Tax=Wenjunlia vitaminophila TaxID=76728 RepID=UPI00036E4627|nr:enoyl-CoA hydratase family protein [Wenjunlia vitaminophila]
MTADPLVRRTDEDGIAVLTLDSPTNRNALSFRMMTALDQNLSAAAWDPQVRAVLLTHAGDVFCAGADLSEATGRNGGRRRGAAESGTADALRRLAWLLRSMVAMRKPVIARINGHVRAGGLGLVGACDIAIAGPRSTFAFTEARLGLAPGVISLPLLPRVAPRAAARYYLTGERFDAAEAARIGLVTEAATDVDQSLAPVLDGLRRASPQGLAESKAMVAEEVLRAFDRDVEDFLRRSTRLFATAEAIEGMTAFLERRQPDWSRPAREGHQRGDEGDDADRGQVSGAHRAAPASPPDAARRADPAAGPDGLTDRTGPR